jgi:hypothetical protein
VAELLAVGTSRDGWDWLQFWVTFVATVTGLIVFIPWALERRRRPEARFHWRISTKNDSSKMEIWPSGYVPEIGWGQMFLVETAIQNVGDAAGKDTLVNFVVPACIELSSYEKPDVKPSVAVGDKTAGLPPTYAVVS